MHKRIAHTFPMKSVQTPHPSSLTPAPIPFETPLKTPPQIPMNTSHFTRRASAGFSLVEVALAIAIVAFAFIALIGLLPTGMQVFRSSMDTANESWIMQDINSILQATPFKKVDQMAAGKEDGVIFAYDDEGKLLDRQKVPTVNYGENEKWQYVAKILVDDIYRPNSENDKMTDARNVTVVIAPYNKAKAVEEFNALTSRKQLDTDTVVSKKTDLRIRCLVLTRMDSIKD
jgi:uncharacterized protein (TIGR02598 family)